MAETLTRAQKRTLPARRALAAKFSTPESRSEHYRQLAAKANAGRVTLSADEAEAVATALRLLGTISAKLPQLSESEASHALA